LTKIKELVVVETLPIPPHAGKVTDALSRIGYKIEEAVSDLVDNCIDALASKVLVRFLHDGKEIKSIVVADNGAGMDKEQLLSAMQFGSARDRKVSDLGKFGMGLKTATFSQGRSLTVISRKKDLVSACRWTTKSIAEGWNCELLDAKSAADWIDEIRQPFVIGKSGTLIVIEQLDHLRVGSIGLESALQKLHKKLSVHIGITFHRFLNKAFEVYIDASHIGGGETGFSIPVDGLDPFDYPVTGEKNFPLDFILKMPNLPNLNLQAHIWPPNQTVPGYILSGGNTSKRQGFYFYRNNRLIQAGGWNGWRENEGDHHFSLARICVNLPPVFDAEFRLNVQKSALDVPESFRNALSSASSPMKRYLRRAEEVYRKKTEMDEDFIPVPGRGFGGAVRNKSGSFLAAKSALKHPVNIIWELLDEKYFFEIDRNAGNIILNSLYRKDILSGQSASLNDAPVTKILLFLLLRDDLLRERESKRFVERLDEINELLMLAVQEERSRQ
jgi:hypothetical protein